jgi:hypothetical protein
MISFVENNKDTLSKLFSNLTYDIQEKIYNEVLILQETEKNKKYFIGYVLGQLKYKKRYHNDNLVNSLYNVYEYYDIGMREYLDTGEYIETTFKRDKIYYDNLDYLLLCDLDTEISLEENNIEYKYELKDIHKHYKTNLEITYHEDEYCFHYEINGMNRYIYDFCEDLEYNNDCNSQSQLEYLYQLRSNDFNEVDNEELKYILYELTRRKLFYGKLEKYNELVLS